MKLRFTRSSSVASLTRFFLRVLGPWKALDAQLAHDRQDQLLVDHHVLLALKRGSDSQHPISAAGSGVDVGDQTHQQESTGSDGPRAVLLVLVEARPRDPGHTAGHTLGVAHVA
jgi:hypothetical protein